MFIRRYFPFAIISMLLLVSCQKEIDGELITTPGASALLGSYKFIEMTAETYVALEASLGSDVEKAETRSAYTTENNTGTMSFDGILAKSANIAYSVDSRFTTYFYYNGVLEDSIEVPFQFTAPATSATSPYQMIGADSIYFSSGSMFVDGSTSGTGTATVPIGYKLKREGNRLLMSTRVNFSDVDESQGIPIYITRQAKMLVTLEKL